MFNFKRKKKENVDKHVPLHIALYGKTLEQANYVLGKIVENNKDDFKNIQRSNLGGFAIFNNGDIISCCSETSPENHFRGVHYDQIYLISGAVVNESLKESTIDSKVPEEDIVQHIGYEGEEIGCVINL